MTRAWQVRNIFPFRERELHPRELPFVAIAVQPLCRLRQRQPFRCRFSDNGWYWNEDSRFGNCGISVASFLGMILNAKKTGLGHRWIALWMMVAATGCMHGRPDPAQSVPAQQETTMPLENSGISTFADGTPEEYGALPCADSKPAQDAVDEEGVASAGDGHWLSGSFSRENEDGESDKSFRPDEVSVWRSIFATILVLGFLGAVHWWLRRRMNAGGAGAGNRRIQLLESFCLDHRRRLLLFRVGENHALLVSGRDGATSVPAFSLSPEANSDQEQELQ